MLLDADFISGRSGSTVTSSYRASVFRINFAEACKSWRTIRLEATKDALHHVQGFGVVTFEDRVERVVSSEAGALRHDDALRQDPAHVAVHHDGACGQLTGITCAEVCTQHRAFAL